MQNYGTRGTDIRIYLEMECIRIKGDKWKEFVLNPVIKVEVRVN
jgi:hypothetical protein